MNRGFRVALLAAILLGGLSPGTGFADPITSALRKQQALQRYASGMNGAYRQPTRHPSGNNYQSSGQYGRDRSAQISFDLAMSHLARGEVTAAIKRFDQVLRLRPNDGDALYQLGICYEIVGSPGDAIQRFSAVPSNHARYAEAQAKLASLGGAVGAPPAVAPMQDPRYAAATQDPRYAASPGDIGYTQDPRYAVASQRHAVAQNRAPSKPYSTSSGSRTVPYGNRSVPYGTQQPVVPPQQVAAVATAPSYVPNNAAIKSQPAQPVQPAQTADQSVQTSALPAAQPAAQSSVTEVGKPVNRPIKDKWALIVGISNFADSTINLKYSAKDALDFKDYLIKSANFAPSHVRTLINSEATRDRIFDEFGDSWLPRAAGPDDLVVIYVSTHGTPADADDIGHVNYLVAYDTDKTKLFSKGIAMQELCGLIKRRIRSDRVLIVLDTCFSGNTAPTGKSLSRTGNVSVDEIALGTGQLVICSSSTFQRSWESKSYENSIFTRKLIESLQTNGAKTTLGQAFAALKEKVEDEARRQYAVTQTPCMNGKWSGNDLILAVPPSAPKPGL